MDMIISGIGGKSSLPLKNPAIRPYLTKRDEEEAETCLAVCMDLYWIKMEESQILI